MLDPAQVLIADNTLPFGQCLRVLLGNYGLLTETLERDGRALLDRIIETKPAVVIMDAYMKGLDAIGVLKEVQKAEKVNPAFVVVSSYDRPFIREEVLRLGAACYFSTADLKLVAERVAGLLGHLSRAEEKLYGIWDNNGKQIQFDSDYPENLDRLVTERLRKINMPTNVNGYFYLKYGIVQILFNGRQPLTKWLYPMIQDKFSCSYYSVDTGLRYVIGQTWILGESRVEELNYYFGTRGQKNLCPKPTPGQFISRVAEDIRAEFIKKRYEV